MLMAATEHHQQHEDEEVSDRIDSLEPLSMSAVDAEDKSVSVQDLAEKPLSAEDETLVPGNISQDANVLDVSRDASCQLRTLDGSEDPTFVNEPVTSAPQVQPVFERVYENTTGEWEDYSHYLNAESIEAGLTGVYSESPSLMFHGGYGYTPQLPPYGPYSPVTTPLPSASGDSPLYSQHLPFAAPYYPQPPPSSMSYLASPTATSQADLTMPVECQGVFLADNPNPNGMLFGPRPDYSVPYDYFGRESYNAGNSGNPGFYDPGQGFDGFRSGVFWPDWCKSPDRMGAITTFSSPAVSPRPIGAFRQRIGPLSSGVASQQQKASHGFGSSVGSYDRGYLHGGMYNQANNFVGAVTSLGTNGQSFIAIEKGRRRGKGHASLCSCNGALDFLNEQNRGPRATRPKNMSGEQNLAGDSNGMPSAMSNHEFYNRSEFSTDYSDAKFFIIKSYSEDNVHKSIKYGVWASTAIGNKKLDSAYQEAIEKGDSCPVFLYFSVNASAQFCGVAEMVGPVDFEKSVDYWQQDKWSGQFPVKWHIIKDVPNNLFRHIILENNDNKPVTNSRDTQEVKLEQGLEMLSIFKKHEADTSILDDFEFYEERQKAMQERKAQQQQQQLLKSNFTRPALSSAAVDEELHYSGPKKSGSVMIKQISKTFAQVVGLEESKSADAQAVDKSSSATNDTDGVLISLKDLRKPAISDVAQSS